MNRKLLPLLASIAISLVALSAPEANAQGLNIGVIDMQLALNKYYKTALEVEKVNDVAKAEKELLDERRADYQILTKSLADLDKKARDASLPQEERQAAYNQLLTVAQERTAKARELQKVEQRANENIIKARQKMELVLVTEIRGIVEQMAKAKGFDLLIDKSFLPKANKVLVYTSEKVPDMTDDLIATINADAPAAPAAAAEAP